MPSSGSQRDHVDAPPRARSPRRTAGQSSAIARQAEASATCQSSSTPSARRIAAARPRSDRTPSRSPPVKRLRHDAVGVRTATRTVDGRSGTRRTSPATGCVTFEVEEPAEADDDLGSVRRRRTRGSAGLPSKVVTRPPATAHERPTGRPPGSAIRGAPASSRMASASSAAALGTPVADRTPATITPVRPLMADVDAGHVLVHQPPAGSGHGGRKRLAGRRERAGRADQRLTERQVDVDRAGQVPEVRCQASRARSRHHTEPSRVGGPGSQYHRAAAP